jgi:hypothetical protein
MTLEVVAGVFNIFAGLMLVAAVLLMGTGAVLWIVRLGTYPTYRDEAIELMKWAVTVLFVLIVLLVVARIVQHYPMQTAFGIGVVFFTIVAWYVVNELTTAETSKEHE